AVNRTPALPPGATAVRCRQGRPTVNAASPGIDAETPVTETAARSSLSWRYPIVRVFLAGGSGVVGRALIPLLTAQGHEVAGTTREPNKAALLRSLGATPVVVDVYDWDGLFAAVRAARPDGVIHQLTDLTHLDFAALARVRIEGTRNLVDAARAAGVSRMV